MSEDDDNGESPETGCPRVGIALSERHNL